MLAFLAMTSGAYSLLWIVAAILVIAGIVTLLRGGVLAGIVLIIVGLLIGPGGVSLFPQIESKKVAICQTQHSLLERGQDLVSQCDFPVLITAQLCAE